MKAVNIMLAGLLLPCVGCLTNHYEKFYVDLENGKGIHSIHGNAPVELRTATSEEDVVNLMEDGYLQIGLSSFTAPYTPMSLAVDTAEDRGAALALVDIKYKETEEYTSVMVLPSTSTSYSSGSVNVNTWGYGGGTYGHGTYSGTTTTTTLNAVPVNRKRDIYIHDAKFFKKIDVSKMYGALWAIPKRLPTEAVDAPVQIRILAVLHGSQAERDGLKRGQIVKSVNGVAIKTRKDMAPFMDWHASITKVETENDK